MIASGVPTLKYQWRKNGAKMIGKTTSSLTFTGLKTTDSANYDVVVSNSFGSVTSSVATVYAVNLPTISKQPKKLSLKIGQTATFSVAAKGTTPLYYQWKKNDFSISGAINSSFSITNVQVADAAIYTATVTNIAGSVTSKGAALSITVTP